MSRMQSRRKHRAETNTMVPLPGGTFTMDSGAFYPEERPLRRVKVDPFWIDQTPVTNRQFADFVEAEGYVTFAEIAPDPNDYPGLDPALAKPGSLVFKSPSTPVPLHDSGRPSNGRAFHPRFRCLIGVTGQGSLDTMKAQALRAHPQGKIDFIRLVAARNGMERMPASWIRFIDKETFYFDPCTASLLGHENRYGGWYGTVLAPTLQAADFQERSWSREAGLQRSGQIIMSGVRLPCAALWAAWLVLASPVAVAAPAAGTQATVSLVLRKAASSETITADAAVVKRLETLGYRVRIVGDDQPVTAADGSNAILISSSVSGYNLGGKYRDVKVPVITWEPALLSYMAMAGKREETDFGEAEDERRLWLVNASHPLGGGAAAGHQIAYPKGVEMGWGKPGLGATIVATVPGEPEKATEFAYEAGATMDYESIAPARRLVIFVANGSFGSLSPAGLALFDAAVRWAVGGEACAPR